MKRILFLFVTLVLLQSCTTKSINGELIFTEAIPSDGFNYPYFLFIPEGTSVEKELTLIVEPNNSGFADDDFKRHIAKAKRTASLDFYIGNFVARELKQPLLVPVFPRSKSDWQIYTHALDSDVIVQKNNPLERIDLQLLAMVADAETKLNHAGYTIRELFFMTGFSASASFTNRFTLIHPLKIQAAAAGGLNGLLMLPIGELKGESLNYPIGTGNFELVFGKPFDSVSYAQTPQFYFMGALDDNDAIPYEDAYSENERELIYKFLGKEMMPTRWEKCKQIYEHKKVNASIKTYPEIGHEQADKVKMEVVEFFKQKQL